MEFNATATDRQAPLWTAQVQHRNSVVKPVKLIELGTGPHGKFARIEFADEVTRPVYLKTMTDAWHPLFDSLAGDECWKIRDFFSPFEPVILPNGNVEKKFHLSFVSRIKTKSGKFVSENSFDVPAQSYEEGELTGIRAAQEYMAAISLPNFGCTSLLDVVRGVAECLAEKAGQDRNAPARGNVAMAFLREMEVMLLFAAKNCGHQKYFEEKIAQRESYEKKSEDRRQQEKTEFVERMRRAKEAKRHMQEHEAVSV